MRIEFTTREHGPKNLLAEAEIFFDHNDHPMLDGMKLTGFAVWATEANEPAVTVPSRSWGDNSNRKFFDLLRAGDGGVEAVRTFKRGMLEAWKEHQKSRRGKQVTFAKDGTAVEETR